MVADQVSERLVSRPALLLPEGVTLVAHRGRRGHRRERHHRTRRAPTAPQRSVAPHRLRRAHPIGRRRAARRRPAAGCPAATPARRAGVPARRRHDERPRREGAREDPFCPRRQSSPAPAFGAAAVGSPGPCDRVDPTVRRSGPGDRPGRSVLLARCREV